VRSPPVDQLTACAAVRTRQGWGNTVKLSFSPLNEQQAHAIAGWRYEPPYDMYNMLDEHETVDATTLTDPDNNYYAITDERGELLAYCCFGPEGRVPGGNYEPSALDVGMGMRPDLTDQGLGRRYLEAIRDFAVRQFQPTLFRVTIAAFNARALRLCEQAGFRETQRFDREGDGLAFVILLRSAQRQRVALQSEPNKPDSDNLTRQERWQRQTG